MKHNSVGPLRSIPPTRRTFSAIFIVLSIVTAFAAFGVPVATSWTYQGQLRRSGAAYNGTCNFQFSLWDAVSAGTQRSDTRLVFDVNVVNGLFTVVLDFGSLFEGDALWLQTNVSCTGDPGTTLLTPRQPITAAPYALSLRPGASIQFGSEEPDGTPALTVIGNDGGGLVAEGRVGVYGVSRASSNGVGVYGEVSGTSGTDSAGVFGVNTNINGVAVRGFSTGGAAIYGEGAGSGPAIYGQATNTGLAGRFNGHVVVEGNLIVQGGLSKTLAPSGPAGRTRTRLPSHNRRCFL